MRLVLLAIFITILAISPLLNLGKNTSNKLNNDAIAATPVNEIKQPTALKGTLTYYQRIALTPESAILLSVKEINTGVTAFEQSYSLNGKQVPIDFNIAIPEFALKADASYYFQGSILVQGKTAWVSDKINLDSSNNVNDLGNVVTKAAVEETTPAIYQCGNQQVAFTVTKDKNELKVNDKTFEMIPVPAANGAKYRSTKGDSTIFWSRGDKAQAKVENMALDECQKIVLPQNDSNASLKDLISDKEWRLIKLNGDDVVNESNITLTLGTDGRLHGKSGCNSYSGAYTLENDKIEVSKALISTMMACVLPGVMEQESRYTSLLTDVTGLKFQEDGNLIASTEDGRALIFSK